MSQVGAEGCWRLRRQRRAIRRQTARQLGHVRCIGEEQAQQFDRIAQLVTGSLGLGQSKGPAAKGAVALQPPRQAATLIESLQAAVQKPQHAGVLAGVELFLR